MKRTFLGDIDLVQNKSLSFRVSWRENTTKRGIIWLFVTFICKVLKFSFLDGGQWAEPKVKTQTRSDAVQNGTNLATTSRHNANRVNLPKQFAPYVAPNLRTHTVSRAIGSSGSLRTYSRVPLHLRGKTRNSNDTTKTLNAKNNSNIADGDIGIATIFKTVTFSSRQLSQWNESGFRPPLSTYRQNWARRTSWGWWDEWDDTVLQTQDSKFEPWRSEAEHTTSRSRRLPTILSFTRGWGRNIFVYFKPPRPGTEPRTLAWKAAVLTTTLGPPPVGCRASHVALVVALVCGQSCNFRVSRRVTRHVPNRADVRVGVFCT